MRGKRRAFLSMLLHNVKEEGKKEKKLEKKSNDTRLNKKLVSEVVRGTCVPG